MTGKLYFGYAAMIVGLSACSLVGGTDHKQKSESKTDAATIASTDTRAPLPSKSCTPTLVTPPRADGAPVDDIVGMRPGMPLADINALLRCRGDIVQIADGDNFYMQNPPHIHMRQQIWASTGEPCSIDIHRIPTDENDGCSQLGNDDSQLFKNRDDMFRIGLVGMPGHERAEGIWRTQTFAPGKQPVSSALAANLTRKYGEPNHSEDSAHRHLYMWVHDLRGRPMSQNNPSFDECRSGTRASFDQDQQWAPACGLTIAAEIKTSNENADLVTSLSVASVDPAGFTNGIKAVLKEAQAAEEQRHRDEVNRARKSAAPVDL